MRIISNTLRNLLPAAGLFAAASCASADAGPAPSVDSALKSRDHRAVLQQLQARGQTPEEIPAPVAPAAAPAPIEPAAPASDADVEAFRLKLAREIEEARAQQQKPATGDPKPAATKPAATKPATGTLADLVPPPPRRPDMDTDAMARNRDALDALVRRSREDVVKMAMGQIAGAPAAEPVVGDDEWKLASPSAWRYNGEWEGGTMHGQGRMVYGDGWEYSGAWKSGVMDGQGTLTYPDGTRYEGQWRNGRMHGMGKLNYPDGWAFIGQWRDGVISGQGTLIHPGQ